MFRLNFADLMLRYYLMMAAVIFAGFSGMWWLALLALPIFLTCLLGLTFDFGSKSEIDVLPKSHEAPTFKIEESEEEVQTAA